MKRFLVHIESYRALFTGFLLVYIVHIFRELFENMLYVGIGLLVSVLAIWFAKKTAHHFHGDHHHAGDSAFDAVPVSVLLLANILHPAVDGLSWYETLTERGVLIGVLYAGSIILHEIVRQSALITALRSMHIKWYWVISTAFFGISLGIVTGIFDTSFFHTYEHFADLATLFAYVFIVSEFHFGEHSISKRSTGFVVGGAVLAIVLSFLIVH